MRHCSADLILRTMKQAKYTTECSGHFGLADKILLSFYISDPQISGFTDSPDHQVII